MWKRMRTLGSWRSPRHQRHEGHRSHARQPGRPEHVRDEPAAAAGGAVETWPSQRTIGVKVLDQRKHPTLELAGPLVLGSDSSCDIELDRPGVAPRHAEIYRVSDLWWVRDLGTEQGVYVDGEPIDAAPLQATTILRLGEHGPSLRLRP